MGGKVTGRVATWSQSGPLFGLLAALSPWGRGPVASHGAQKEADEPSGRRDVPQEWRCT